MSGRHDDKGQALVAELRALGAEAEFVRADVRRKTTSAPLSTKPSQDLAVSTLQ